MTPIDQPVPDEVRELATKALAPHLGNVKFGCGPMIARAIEQAIMADRSRPSMSGMRVKELEWSEPSKPNAYCGYNHFFADTPFGRYQVEWKGWKEYPGFTLMFADRDFIPNGDTIESAKAAAQADYETRILSALITPDPAASADEAEGAKCFICDKPLLLGQLVLMDVTEGLGHRACFGDDREGFVKDINTGEPLGPDDPLPAGFPYEPAEVVAWRWRDKASAVWLGYGSRSWPGDPSYFYQPLTIYALATPSAPASSGEGGQHG